MLYFCLLSVSFIFSISILFGIWLPCQPPCPPPPSPPLTSWYGSCIAKNDQVLYGTACCHFLLDKPINILKKGTVYLSSFWGPLYFTIEGTKPLAPRGKRMTESQREKGFRFFWGISTCPLISSLVIISICNFQTSWGWSCQTDPTPALLPDVLFSVWEPGNCFWRRWPWEIDPNLAPQTKLCPDLPSFHSPAFLRQNFLH